LRVDKVGKYVGWTKC